MLLFDAYLVQICPFLVQICPFLVQICPFLVQICSFLVQIRRMRWNLSLLDTVQTAVGVVTNHSYVKRPFSLCKLSISLVYLVAESWNWQLLNIIYCHCKCFCAKIRTIPTYTFWQLSSVDERWMGSQPGCWLLKSSSQMTILISFRAAVFVPRD